jgi:hypothetical protein
MTVEDVRDEAPVSPATAEFVYSDTEFARFHASVSVRNVDAEPAATRAGHIGMGGSLNPDIVICHEDGTTELP